MGEIEKTLLEAVEKKIKNNKLDKVQSAPLVAAAAKLAKLMDNEEFPIVNGKFDNVSPSTFLKYCEKLHLTDEIKIEKKETKLSEIQKRTSMKVYHA